MIILFQLQDFHSQQRPTAQIESSLSFFSRSPADLLLSSRLRLLRSTTSTRGSQASITAPVLPGFHYDPCPQDFVSSDYLIDASLQRHKVQAAPQPYGSRNVVEGAAGIQLVEEPQSLLRERQRQSLLSGYSDQRRRLILLPALSDSSILRDKSSAVGFSKTLLTPRSTPDIFLTREITCVARSEWPPSSKKLSFLPTRSSFSTSSKIPTTICSSGVSGAGYPFLPSAFPHIRRRQRLTIEFAVGFSGRASSIT